jgi:transcription elongation factor Elf1
MTKLEPQFLCPKCGSTVFKLFTEPKTIEDFNGAVCSNCGTSITEQDIKSQALQIAEKAAREAFRDSGLNED